MSATGGTLVQIGCIRDALPYLNPCGTIVAATVCTPQEWILATLQPEHYRDYDPTCTIPTLCGPIGAQTGTGTTTTTGTTTGTGLTQGTGTGTTTGTGTGFGF
jgi:hypothetical protein